MASAHLDAKQADRPEESHVESHIWGLTRRTGRWIRRTQKYMSKSKHKSKENKPDKSEKPAKAVKPKKKDSALESKSPAKAVEEKPKKAATRKPAAPKKAASLGKISQDDIALRAYYIGEERRRTGTPGSSHGDWLEAECQLRAETK